MSLMNKPIRIKFLQQKCTDGFKEQEGKHLRITISREFIKPCGAIERRLKTKIYQKTNLDVPSLACHPITTLN